MKIFLIGYMGSGKSTAGKLLADKLNLSFVDFDKYIEKQTGKTIAEIFDQGGEEKFRMLEHEHLQQLIPKEKVVISLGGGTPCFYNHMELINKNGISIYLDVETDDLVTRLSRARNKRPLIQGLNEVDLRFFVEANLEKRMTYYQQANIIIKSGKKKVEEITEEMVNALASLRND